MSAAKQFFRKTWGYIGADSHSVRSGDPVVLIPGLNSAVTIRPVGENYHLIALLYVHGMMKGEFWNKRMSMVPSATAGIINAKEILSVLSQSSNLKIM